MIDLESKQIVINTVEFMVLKKTLLDMKTKGIFDSFDYINGDYPIDNATALIKYYEKKTGNKAELMGRHE